MNQKTVTIIGRIASVMAVLMYVSYITQIIANLHGNKGEMLQPLVATINCILWSIYGFNMKPKDWPIIIANVPGIFLAGITFITAL